MSDFIFSGNLRCTRDIYVGPNQKKPVMSISSNGDVRFGGTRGIRVPEGTSLERPFGNGPLNELHIPGDVTTCRTLGYIRFNTETNKYEGYGVCHATGFGEWGDIGGVASGRFHVVDGGSQTTRVKVQSSLDKYGGTGLMFYTGVQGQNPNVRMNIDSTGNVGIGLAENGSTGFPVTPCCALHVGGTDAIKIPSGTTAQRPATSSTSEHSGFIRYNTTTKQFEGYGACNSWGSLGGVQDVDCDTFIRAETSANADNDELEFFAAGNKKMTISSSNILIDSTLQVTKQVEILQLSKTIIQSDGDVTINGTVKIGLDADAPTTLNNGLYLWNSGTNLPSVLHSVGHIGSNQIAFNTGEGAGSEKVRIGGNGNVGIGTSAPGSKLDVNGSIRAGYDTNTTCYFGRALVGSYPAFPDWAGFSNINHNDYALVHCNSGTTSLNGTETSFQVNGYTKMRLANNGNFGIGTTSPGYKLEVAGDIKLGFGGATGGKIIFKGTNNDAGDDECLIENRIYGGTEQSELLLFKGNDPLTTAGPDRIRLRAGRIILDTYSSPTTDRESVDSSATVIDHTGKVGIGTSNPRSKLDVEGNVAIGSTYSGSYAAPTNGLLVEGNVGIGTNTPGERLHINGKVKITNNSGENMILEGTQCYLRYRRNNTNLGWIGYYPDNTNLLYVNNDQGNILLYANDNVGIGTTTPSDKLDVNGTVKATKFKVGTSTSTSYDSALSIGSYPANPWLVFSDNQWKTPIQLKQYYHYGGTHNNERDLPLPDGMTTQKDWFANAVAWWVDGFDIDEGSGGRNKARGVYVRFDDTAGKWKIRWGFASENGNTDFLRTFRVTIMWIHKNLVTFKGGSHTSAKDNTWGHYTQWTNTYGTENIP